MREISTLSHGPHLKTNKRHLSSDTGNGKPLELGNEGAEQLSPKVGIPEKSVVLSIARMTPVGRCGNRLPGKNALEDKEQLVKIT